MRHDKFLTRQRQNGFISIYNIETEELINNTQFPIDKINM